MADVLDVAVEYLSFARHKGGDARGVFQLQLLGKRDTYLKWVKVNPSKSSIEILPGPPVKEDTAAVISLSEEGLAGLMDGSLEVGTALMKGHVMCANVPLLEAFLNMFELSPQKMAEFESAVGDISSNEKRGATVSLGFEELSLQSPPSKFSFLRRKKDPSGSVNGSPQEQLVSPQEQLVSSDELSFPEPPGDHIQQQNQSNDRESSRMQRLQQKISSKGQNFVSGMKKLRRKNSTVADDGFLTGGCDSHTQESNSIAQQEGKEPVEGRKRLQSFKTQMQALKSKASEKSRKGLSVTAMGMKKAGSKVANFSKFRRGSAHQQQVDEDDGGEGTGQEDPALHDQVSHHGGHHQQQALHATHLSMQEASSEDEGLADNRHLWRNGHGGPMAPQGDNIESSDPTQSGMEEASEHDLEMLVYGNTGHRRRSTKEDLAQPILSLDQSSGSLSLDERVPKNESAARLEQQSVATAQPALVPAPEADPTVHSYLDDPIPSHDQPTAPHSGPRAPVNPPETATEAAASQAKGHLLQQLVEFGYDVEIATIGVEQSNGTLEGALDVLSRLTS